MKNKMTVMIAGFLALSAVIGTNVNSQTRNDVITFYNEGAKAMQTDVPAAITAFENVVSTSDKVGEEAADARIIF
jgi:hypothetical protein